MLYRDKSAHQSEKLKAGTQGQLYFLDDVSVTFGNIKALNSIHLNIHHKEKLFITGPSGAGKTTLLKVLAGLIKVDSGRIYYPDNELRNGMFFSSMIFQDLRLMEQLSAEDNLWMAYDPQIYENKNEFYKDLMEYSKFFGIQSKLDLSICKANGGLKQKIAIIRSLLTLPRIILADEPTSALDKENAVKLFEILSYLNEKQGLTIIWASHNKELIKHFNGRILHLDSGKLVYTGHACFI